MMHTLRSKAQGLTSYPQGLGHLMERKIIQKMRIKDSGRLHTKGFLPRGFFLLGLESSKFNEASV